MRFLVVLLASVFLAGTAGAQSVPQFRDYPTEVYRGAIAAPQMTTPTAQMFRTRLREGVRRGQVNFAGRYVLVTWGCGSSCVTGAVVDAVDGAVHDLPFSVCCALATHDGFRPIEMRPDSRLIVFAGLLNEEPPMAAHFFEFAGGQFRRVATIPNDGSFR